MLVLTEGYQRLHDTGMLTRADLMNLEESLDELLLLAKVDLRRAGGPLGSAWTVGRARILSDIIENGGWALRRVRDELAGFKSNELELSIHKEEKKKPKR